MSNTTLISTSPSRIALPMSATSRCFALSSDAGYGRATDVVRERHLTIKATGLGMVGATAQGAFPGPDAWSPPD